MQDELVAAAMYFDDEQYFIICRYSVLPDESRMNKLKVLSFKV